MKREDMEYAVKTIELLIAGKPIKDLDERLSYFKSICQEDKGEKTFEQFLEKMESIDTKFILANNVSDEDENFFETHKKEVFEYYEGKFLNWKNICNL